MTQYIGSITIINRQSNTSIRCKFRAGDSIEDMVYAFGIGHLWLYHNDMYVNKSSWSTHRFKDGDTLLASRDPISQDQEHNMSKQQGHKNCPIMPAADRTIALMIVPGRGYGEAIVHPGQTLQEFAVANQLLDRILTCNGKEIPAIDWAITTLHGIDEIWASANTNSTPNLQANIDKLSELVAKMAVMVPDPRHPCPTCGCRCGDLGCKNNPPDLNEQVASLIKEHTLDNVLEAIKTSLQDEKNPEAYIFAMYLFGKRAFREITKGEDQLKVIEQLKIEAAAEEQSPTQPEPAPSYCHDDYGYGTYNDPYGSYDDYLDLATID